MDTYESFKKLKENESAFNLEILDRGSEVTILAPHGGNIEPHTSDIARLIAADRYNLFCFNGQRQRNNHHLHITSHRYDEEHALALVTPSIHVITIHGCTRLDEMIFIGGLHTEMQQCLVESFTRYKLPHEISTTTLPNSGRHPSNICNRGKNGRGIQLEISRSLRDSPDHWTLIAESVHRALGCMTPS